MGRRSKSAPRHGSLAYLPRGRAKRPVGKINHWPKVEMDVPKLLGFAGYKVGMSFVYVISTRRGSPNFGQEVHRPVTFVEAPPTRVCGIRSYSDGVNGLKTMTEIWTETLPKDIERVITPPKKTTKFSVKNLQADLKDVKELRAILSTQPRLGNVPQKKPELFEVKVAGGTITDQFDYLCDLLGKEVSISDIFTEGQSIDVIAVTKGKGVQGPVKRWGVKTLPHKSRKTVRGIGTLGAWTPHYVMYSVPRAGQMGFHQRTERNKKILKIGNKDQVPLYKGGFPHYGTIRDAYTILEGSIPGPAKRLVKFRYADRVKSTASETPPNITYMDVQLEKG